MAKKKNKSGSKKSATKSEKKPEAKKAAENPLVVSAREAYVGGNYAAVRTLHGRAGELQGEDQRALEDLFQKTLTDKAPWLIAAGGIIVTVIAGILTLS